MDEVAVVHIVHRSEGVQVRRHAETGLRLAGGDHDLGLQTAHNGVGLLPHRGSGLAEDVVAVVITGMVQRSVALGVRLLQHAELAHRVSTTLDPDALRRHTDPHRPLAHHVDPRQRPGRPGVETGGHVQPLHVHRATEGLRRRGTPHHDAGLVVRSVLGLDGPGAVLGQRNRRRVTGGRAGDEVLLLHVIESRTIESRRTEHDLAGASGDRTFDGGGTHATGRRRNRSERRLGGRRRRGFHGRGVRRGCLGGR